MKKSLLLASVALVATTSWAQVQADEAIEATGTAISAQLAPALTDDATKASPAYYVPGAFFSSYAQGGYAYTSAQLHMPPFADATFVNYSKNATGYSWKYVDPSIVDYNMFNPQLTSTDENLVVNYQYPGHTIIEAPVLTATNEAGDSLTSAATGAPVYLRVGRGLAQGSAAANNTYYGWTNVSPKAGSLYISSNYFLTNAATPGTNWASLAQMGTASVRGFAEVYEKPLASYALTGFACHVRSTVAIEKPVYMTIYKATLNANGYLTAIEPLCYQVAQPDAFVAAGTSRYYTVFDKLIDAETNEVVEGYTIDYPIVVTITLPDDDTTTQIGGYYTATTVNIPTHNYVILNGTDSEGNTENGVFYPAGLNWSSGTYTRSFQMFSLLGSFEYLRGNDHEMTASWEGDVKTFELAASKPNTDALGLDQPEWTVTQADGTALPDWVKVSLKDNWYTNDDGDYVYPYSTDATVTVTKATERVVRECDVKIAFLGAEPYIIHVSQDATTGIETVEVAADDANQDTYNMMGQKVGADAKGILIRNGKKILVK